MAGHICPEDVFVLRHGVVELEWTREVVGGSPLERHSVHATVTYLLVGDRVLTNE